MFSRKLTHRYERKNNPNKVQLIDSKHEDVFAVEMQFKTENLLRLTLTHDFVHRSR